MSTGSCSTKKQTNGLAVARKPMAMQPAIARQNRSGVWLYKRPLRRHISDFFSSATKTLPHWFFTDAKIHRWNASAAGLDLLQRPACRFGRSPLPFGTPLYADDTHAECVSYLGKTHADAPLSGTDYSHYESFSLASLRSRIAFFSESDSGAEDSSGGWQASSHRLNARVPHRHRRESIRLSSSLNMISVPPRLQATWSRLVRSLSASWQKLTVSSGLNGLRLRSHLAAGWMSGFSRGTIKTSTNAGPPKILVRPLPVSHPSFCFYCSHISWCRWRERIRAPAPSGWVCGHTSLPVHCYWMEGVGEPSVQAVPSHTRIRMRTCLLGGWTSGFGSALYGCVPGLPGQDACQWGSRSGCSFTRGPEEHDRSGPTCHQSHSPSHRAFDVLWIWTW